MNAKEKFALTFYELLGEREYADITITMLCERSDLSRKTFYAHFGTLFDVATYIFDERYFQPFLELITFTRNYEIHPSKTNAHFFGLISKDVERARRFVNIRDADASMVEHLVGRFKEFNLMVQNDVDAKRFEGKPLLAEYVSYYTACAWVQTTAKWLNENPDLPPEEFLSFIFEAMNFFPRRCIQLYE